MAASRVLSNTQQGKCLKSKIFKAYKQAFSIIGIKDIFQNNWPSEMELIFIVSIKNEEKKKVHKVKMAFDTNKSYYYI